MESSMPGDGTGDVAELHQTLIDKVKSAGHIRSPAVEAAFRAIPRHTFLPGVSLDEVYRDWAVSTKQLDGVSISASSQPTIMAIMLEQLDLKPGHRVLEIGAGTGYNAALMAHIVGDTGEVITLDIDEDIVENARRHLAAAGFERVQVIRGDGGYGYAEAAPYDRIILTVGAWDIVPAWREQLKPGGRLVLPLSIRGMQESIAFERVDGHLESVSVSPCGFMTLRGAFAAPEGFVGLGPERGLRIWFDDRSLVDAEATYGSLTGPSQDWPATITITPREIFDRFHLWLASREPRLCLLNGEGEWANRGIVPYLFGIKDKFCSSGGLLGGASLCLLMRPPGQSPPVDQPADFDAAFDLYVRSFGPDDTLARQLLDHITAWDRAGRPSDARLRIRAYPRDTGYLPSANECVILKRWIQLVFDWQ